MDARWQQRKVCDVMMTPSGLWTLEGSGATPARYIYIHLVKNIYYPKYILVPLWRYQPRSLMQFKEINPIIIHSLFATDKLN